MIGHLEKRSERCDLENLGSNCPKSNQKLGRTNAERLSAAIKAKGDPTKY